MLKLCSVSPTSVALSVMSAKDPRSVRDSCDDQPLHRKKFFFEPFRQERAVNGSDTRHGSTSAPLEVPSSRNSAAAAVTVTAHIGRCGSFLEAAGLAAMHQDDNKLKRVDARFGAKQDTALGTWRKCWQLFGCSDGTFVGSSEAELDMPYIRCPKEQYLARLSPLAVLLKDLHGSSRWSGGL